MAVVERLRAAVWNGKAKEAAQPVADARTDRLSEVAEPLARPRRNGEYPRGDPEEQAVGLGEMGVQHGGAIRLGNHHAEPRPPE